VLIEFGIITDMIVLLFRKTESLMLVAVDGIIIFPEASVHDIKIPFLITGFAKIEINEIHKIKHK
jgi:hypothetical protein